jgi:glutaredoxin 3
MSDADLPRVEMYSSAFCPYCSMARRLLSSKGIDVDIHSVDGNPELRAEMEARSGRYTVPQIFIADVHVGGCDDLHAADRDGRLDGLLAGETA